MNFIYLKYYDYKNGMSWHTGCVKKNAGLFAYIGHYCNTVYNIFELTSICFATNDMIS